MRSGAAKVSFGELTTGATVLFTDTLGSHWSRTGQALEHEDAPPRIC